MYREIVESGPRKFADLMQALLAFLGRNDMMAYLVMMAIRLVELHRKGIRFSFAMRTRVPKQEADDGRIKSIVPDNQT